MMKLWVLLPIFTEVVLAISADEVYKQHLDLYKRGHLANRHSTHGRRLNRLPLDTPKALKRRAARCGVKTTSSSTTSTTTSSTKEPTHVLAPSTPAPPVETTSTTNEPALPPTTYTPVLSTKTEPPPATTSGSDDGGGSTPSSDIQAYLDGHNGVRAKHGAAALTWSDKLAAAAQKWAEHCVFEHSGGSLGPYGENLAAGSGDYSIASGIKSWADEEPQYHPSNPEASHYTQMVWKSTKQVGCAVASCDLSVFTPNFWPAKFYVCEYYPAGNVIGEFDQNVQ